MNTRILFLINGLGLGNSTRCHAIIQRLLDTGAEIAIVTSGNGLWYFRDYLKFPRVFEIAELHYGKKEGRLSIAATIMSVRSSMRTLSNNSKTISRILNDFSPEAVVTDSVYTFAPIKKFGVPIVSVNNADVVYKSYFRIKEKPLSIAPQFYFVELLDYLYHRIIADKIISPSLDPNLPRCADKFYRVGPIVRDEVRPPPPTPAGAKSYKIVIMLSGSTFSSQIKFVRKSYPAEIDIVGRAAPEGIPPHPNITYHGKVKNSIDILRDADLLVINGGFSAVSEGVVLRKPLLVIPVPNHAEQWINAHTIETLGVGLKCTEETVEDTMLSMFDSLQQFRDAYDRLPPPADDAGSAANLILETARRKR